MLRTLLLIAAGGAAGSVCRYILSSYIKVLYFPGTLVVNILGCFLIGLLAGLDARFNLNTNLRMLLVVGFCGGFTTFSSFSIENMELIDNQKYFTAFAYISLSVILGLAAVLIGIKITSR